MDPTPTENTCNLIPSLFNGNPSSRLMGSADAAGVLLRLLEFWRSQSDLSSLCPSCSLGAPPGLAKASPSTCGCPCGSLAPSVASLCAYAQKYPLACPRSLYLRSSFSMKPLSLRRGAMVNNRRGSCDVKKRAQS